MRVITDDTHGYAGGSNGGASGGASSPLARVDQQEAEMVVDYSIRVLPKSFGAKAYVRGTFDAAQKISLRRLVPSLSTWP